MATTLHGWLPQVIQSVEPWVSSNDIEKGARWAADIAAHLDGTNFGIVCLDASNMDAPWIQFEAGALAKSLVKGRVATLLFDGGEQIPSGNPLVQFQFTRFVKEDMFQLLKSLNNSGGQETAPIRENILLRTFDLLWPELEKAVSSIVKTPTTTGHRDGASARQQQAFDEITSLVREQMKRLIALEQQVGLLLPDNVSSSDGVAMITFLDRLIEYAQSVLTALVPVEPAIHSLDRLKQYEMEMAALQGVMLATQRLQSAVQTAHKGGGTGKAMRAAMPDLSRALAALHLR